MSESEQKKSGCERQVDFYIEEDNRLILIEAKAIEATDITRINPLDDVMSNSYKKNIVKALYQANSVYSKIGKGKVPYLLVITYKDLFLGDGENVWDEFMSNALRETYGTAELEIPVENIFFMSVEGFDKLMVCSEGKIGRMFSILEDIVIRKRNIADKRFVFTHYLEDFEEVKLADRRDVILNSKFDEFYKGIIRKYFPLRFQNQ